LVSTMRDTTGRSAAMEPAAAEVATSRMLSAKACRVAGAESARPTAPPHIARKTSTPIDAGFREIMLWGYTFDLHSAPQGDWAWALIDRLVISGRAGRLDNAIRGSESGTMGRTPPTGQSFRRSGENDAAKGVQTQGGGETTCDSANVIKLPRGGSGRLRTAFPGEGVGPMSPPRCS
jgi:hypothetical protein